MPFFGEIAGLATAFCWTATSLFFTAAGTRVGAYSVNLIRITLAVPMLGLTLWLWRRKQGGAWLTAWVIFSGYMALVAMGARFPWYLCWPWMVSLTRWNRTGAVLSSTFYLVGFVLSMYYGMPLATR